MTAPRNGYREDGAGRAMNPAPPTGDSDREALMQLVGGRLPGAAADAVLAAGFRRPATGDTLTDTDKEELHGHVVGCDTDALLDTVERILADHRTGEADLRARIEAALTYCDEYPGDQTCITAGPEVLAADGCVSCRLRAALATDPEGRQL